MELRRLLRGDLAAAMTAGGAAARILVPLHDLSGGGSERIAIRLANRWATAGRRVTLLCGARTGPLEALVGDGVTVAQCEPPIPRGRGSRGRLGHATARLLERNPADLVFVPGNYHWPAIPPIARLSRTARPVIVAQISNPLFRPERGPVGQALFGIATRRRLRTVAACVSLSDAMTAEADRMLGRRITSRIPLPALDDDMPPPRPVPPSEPVTILAAGRLVPQKAFDVALRAFARADPPGATLVVLGEGPERDRLLALASELGVGDRVQLPGHVPDIRPWLDRSRLFLLSSRYEGYGAVVIEALAAGRPVVATACTPAAFELLDRPERGRVACVGDVQGLAAAITTVLGSPPPDPEALAQAVSAHRIGPVAQAYLDLFDGACGARP